MPGPERGGCSAVPDPDQTFRGGTIAGDGRLDVLITRVTMQRLTAPSTPTLLGRDRELEELHAALRSAEHGKGALALLVGEPGIGKTRLANDFASEATARGAQVLVLFEECGGFSCGRERAAFGAAGGGGGAVRLALLAQDEPPTRRR